MLTISPWNVSDVISGDYVCPSDRLKKTRMLALEFQEDRSDSWLCNGNFCLHRIPKESSKKEARIIIGLGCRAAQ